MEVSTKSIDGNLKLQKPVIHDTQHHIVISSLYQTEIILFQCLLSVNELTFNSFSELMN